MTFRTDPARTEIAREVLAAMLRGATSVTIDPRFINAVQQGILEAPRLAVKLTDMLIAELEKPSISRMREEPKARPWLRRNGFPTTEPYRHAFDCILGGWTLREMENRGRLKPGSRGRAAWEVVSAAMVKEGLVQ